MGYTHHWAYPAHHRAYTHAWPRILDDTRRIVEHARAAGIVIAGPDGHFRPIMDNGSGIAFNGDATTDLDADTFRLHPPVTVTDSVVRGLCKTNRNPYDAAVAAILLRCHLLLPEIFDIGSDGGWDAEWAYGAIGRLPGHPPSRLTARRINAELFGAVPATDPLRRRSR